MPCRLIVLMALVFLDLAAAVAEVVGVDGWVSCQLWLCSVASVCAGYFNLIVSYEGFVTFPI